MDVFKRSKFASDYLLEAQIDSNTWVVSKRDETHQECMLYVFDARSTDFGLDPRLLRESQGARLCNPNLVKFYDMDYVYACNNFQKGECQAAHVLLVSEKTQDLDQEIPKTWLKNVLQALQYLHRHCYVHKRLVPSALFQTAQGVKLGDFAHVLVGQVPDTAMRRAEHHLYQAPEHLVGYRKYTWASDMWSLGVLMYEWLFQRNPFCDSCQVNWWTGVPDTSNPDHVMRNIVSKLGAPDVKWRRKYTGVDDSKYSAVHTRQLEFPDNKHPKWNHVIKQCLQYDPAKRMTSLAALRYLGFKPSRSCRPHSVGYAPQKPPKGPFTEMRRIICNSVGDEVVNGRLDLLNSVAALYVFDRGHRFFKTSIFESSHHGEVNRDLVWDIYITCYAVATKLLFNVSATKDTFLLPFETLLGAMDPDKRLTLLYVERILVKHLLYDFGLDKVTCLSTDQLADKLGLSKNRLAANV